MKSSNLRVGEQHPVRLAGLGTAGYHWLAQAEGDEGVATVSRRRSRAAREPPHRHERRRALHHRGRASGRDARALRQRRPFEPDDAPAANEHVIEVRVT